MTGFPRSTTLAAPIVFVAGPALADQAHETFTHPMMWGAWGWAGMILGPLLMIAVLAAVVAAAVLLVRWMGGTPAAGPAAPANTPLDILNERFAKGEIDKQDFEERRRLLSP